MLPSSLQAEGRFLPSIVLPHFERFYRANLRRVTGRRVRSSFLLAAYAAWAANNDAPSINYGEQRRSMRAIGHQAIKSNGIQFIDVAFAVDVPGLLDNYRAHPLASIPVSSLRDEAVTSLDAAIEHLMRLRVALIEAGR